MFILYKLLLYKIKQLNILQNENQNYDKIFNNLEKQIIFEKKYVKKTLLKLNNDSNKNILWSYYFFLDKKINQKIEEKKINVLEKLNMAEIQKNIKL
ncbi:MAG: hypothetical protein OEZ13_09790 [Spirochaetia bacterium]|nr:hypothetical protein [Spirochaetia bacterium]